MARGRIYNQFYTEELWKKVNKENKAILNDFLAEYKQRKKAPKTINAYFQNLRIVFIYILKELDNKCILDLTRRDFRGLSLYMTDVCGMSPARANSIKSACNSMLTFCEEDDEYDYEINQSKKVKSIPNEKVRDNEENFFFTFNEFIKVREKLIEKGKIQTAAMFSLMYDSGCRRNEIAQVLKEGILDGNRTNVVVGKRGKKFPLFFLDDTKEIIRMYLEERGDDDIPDLWIKGKDDTKEPIKSDAIYNRFLYISKILSEVRGKKCEIFPHSVRHSRLQSLIEGTDTRIVDKDGKPMKFPLEKVQILAHHSSSETTQKYLKNAESKQIEEMFGLSQIKEVENEISNTNKIFE